MGWNRIKKMFKTKYRGSTAKETIENNMQLRSRHMGDGRYEVNGVVFYADTHNEALTKYRRAKRMEEQR